MSAPNPVGCSQAEWAARVELAACYRVFASMGWTELIFNHITLRVPGEPGHFLINPFGLHYTEVCASNLVKIDLEGRHVGASQHRINPAGFVIHSAIHGGIADAHCVMHTHTTAGMAVACTRAGLTMSNFYSVNLGGRVSYHDFEGVTTSLDEGPRLIRSFGDNRAMILRSHGLISHGRTVAEAFVWLWTLNRACEIQVATASLGTEIEPIPDSAWMDASRAGLQWTPENAQAVFDAMRRQIDRVDPGYVN
jgi:ribulose-5-phosphate 4-epimerase/fuculose-1-phosphate aldolase